MSLTIGALLIILSALSLAYPFFRPSKSELPNAPNNTSNADTNPVDILTNELEQLRSDLDAGTIAPSDYEHALHQLRYQTATRIRQRELEEGQSYAINDSDILNSEIELRIDLIRKSRDKHIYPEVN